jgi:thymidylate synthase (FAD)
MTHQLVRHRIASYTQQSQRYVAYDTLKDYVIPPNIAKNVKAKKEFDETLKRISETYQSLLIVTMNARELRHFFNVRCCARAQWEMREAATEMLKQAKKATPALFENAGPTCVELGCCSEGKMKPPDCDIAAMKKQFQSL